MTLLAVEENMGSIIDGMVVPGFAQGIQVFVGRAPSKPAGLRDHPVAFVFPQKFPWKRNTMPRAQPGDIATGGFISRMYTIMVWIDAAFLATDQDRAKKFHAMTEMVAVAYTNAPTAIYLYDYYTPPATSGNPIVSQLIDVAEKGQAQLAPDHTTVQGGMFVSSVAFALQVQEDVQG